MIVVGLVGVSLCCPAGDEEEEAKKEAVIEEACYVNRALCNLEKSECITPDIQFFDHATICQKSDIATHSIILVISLMFHVAQSRLMTRRR